MLPTAVSQILEQIVNAVVSIVAAYYLMSDHSASKNLSAWGAAGGTVGTLLGAASALLFLGMIYTLYRPVLRRQSRRDRITPRESAADYYKLTFGRSFLSYSSRRYIGLVELSMLQYLTLRWKPEV